MSFEILAQVVYKKNMDLVVAGKLDENKLFNNMQEHMTDLVEFIEGWGGSLNKTETKSDPNESNLVCPACNKGNWFEDNRQKIASDNKFAKIPVFSCSDYKDKQGCGWKTWDYDVLPAMEKEFDSEPPVAKEQVDNSVAPF
jgi:hypothetical protein